MDLQELKKQLASINEAIKNIEGGAQEYRLSSDTTVKRGDLATLYAERRRLIADIAAMENGGGAFVAAYVRG